MFTGDILNLILGTVVGGVLKIISAKMEMRRMEVEHLTKRQRLSDDSADRAAMRGGPWVRRFIALTVIGYLFISPLILELFRPEVPVIYAYAEGTQGWWRFKGIEQLKFVEMDGYVILPFQRDLAAMIAGFYFGSGIVKR